MTQSKLQTLQPKFHLKPMTLPQTPDLVQSLFFVEAETVSGGQRQKDSKSEKAESGGHISGLEIGTITMFLCPESLENNLRYVGLESMALQFQQLRIVISSIQRFYFILKM